MEDTTPYSRTTLLKEHCELQSTIAGYWSCDTIQSYFDELNTACIPLIKERLPIYALVDFSSFMPQDRSTSDAIRDHLLLSAKFGLKSIAIIDASSLARMQYKRLSKGINVEYFKNRYDAIIWLREGK